MAATLRTKVPFFPNRKLLLAFKDGIFDSTSDFAVSVLFSDNCGCGDAGELPRWAGGSDVNGEDKSLTFSIGLTC